MKEQLQPFKTAHSDILDGRLREVWSKADQKFLNLVVDTANEFFLRGS